MPLPNWQVFDRIRAFARQGNIFRSDNIYQDQDALDRVISGGNFIDFSRQSALLEQTNLQINRLERYKDYDMMDEVGEITLALDMYCLDGDTRVPLLDGTYPTIKELSESGLKEYWVYSYDIERGEYVPAKARNAHVSGYNADLLQIEFDDGLIIRCTGNHKILTQNGYMAADELEIEQSIIPLYKTRMPPLSAKHSTLVEREYEHIKLASGKWRPTHQWIYEEIYGERKGVYNNIPTNLELMSWKAHEELHRRYAYLPPDVLERKKAKISRRLKEKWKDADYREKIKLHSIKMGQQLHESGNSFRRTEEYSEVTWPVFQEYINNDGNLDSIRKIAANLNCAQRVICRLLERQGITINDLRQAKVGNHKIKSIKKIGKASKVYDLYVEKHHNLAVGDNKSWVIVHNSDEASLADPERKHSVIVKAKDSRLRKVVEDLLYNTLLMDKEIRPIVRYLCKYGDFPAEIVPTKNRDGVASFRFINVYNFTRIQTKFGDLVGFYYQDPTAMTPVFLHPWQTVHMRLTTYENIYHPYGRCYDTDGRVWTPDGSKALKNIERGDEVYSFDTELQRPVVTKVLNKVITGTKPTLTIKTKHRTIRVTPEHPMLTVVKDNFVCEEQDCKGNKRNKPHKRKQHKRDIKTKQYVLANNLAKGDKLVLPKLHNEGEDISLLAHKCDNPNKPMQFPTMVNEDFAKLMGFCIGDGWIPTHNDGHLCLAEGEDTETNLKYIDIVTKFGYPNFPNLRLPKEKRTVELGTPYPLEDRKSYGYFDFSSKELAYTLAEMGLSGKCYEKRVPGWVFRAKEEIKKAFVEGLVDADGSTNVDKWDCTRYQIELTSEELVKDLKILLDQMNVKCGNVSKRKRSKMTTIIDGEEYIRRPSWILYWYDAKMSSGDLMHMGKRRTKYDHSSEDYLVESIISIEDGGEIEVGDIQVESGHHNFIADGVVIHNSVLDGGRKDFKRLRLMEDAALIYRITRAPEKRIFSIPVGNIPPKEVPQYIELIARQFKKFKFVDPATGSVNERYSPLIQEDDFFLPKRPDGSGPTIDTLPGAENLDAIADIEYFKKKMVAGLKIPFNRVGIGDQSEPDGKSLAQISPEFAKGIQWIQKEVINGLKKICIVHLAMRGHSIEDIKSFDLHMTAASAIDELYRIETWNTRADIMGNLKDIGWFPPEWIIERFTDMSTDEIREMQIDTGKDLNEPEPEQASEERYWKDRESRLLSEYKRFNKRVKENSSEDQDLSNLEYMLNSKELDGLPESITNDDEEDDGKLLVENSIDDSIVKEVRDETETMLLGGTGIGDQIGTVKMIAATVSDETDGAQEADVTDDQKLLVEDVAEQMSQDVEKSES